MKSFLFPFSFFLAFSIVFSLPGCQHSDKPAIGPKVAILGFDGVDYRLLKSLMAQGKLPEISALSQTGSLSPLASTIPAESPVAWASFTTGSNPGKTRVFDFLKRDPKTYRPQFGIAELKEGKFILKGLIPLRKPKVIQPRQGETLWGWVDSHGLSPKVMRAPVSFPPDDLDHGHILTGLGTPDLRGTNSSYTYFATDVFSAEDTVFGGKVIGMDLIHDVAETKIPGPKKSSTPLRFKRLGTTSLEIATGGRSETVTTGSWSPWMDFSFKIHPLIKLRGIGRFFVESVSPEVRVYLSPMSFDPRNPPFPVSQPPAWSRDLASGYGLFKTLGWDYDTWAFNEGHLSGAAFIQDAYHTHGNLKTMVINELKKPNWNLFLSVFEITDRMSHVFWFLRDKENTHHDRTAYQDLGDPIAEAYQLMDVVVGEARKALPEGTPLILLSDHGFSSFRKAVNLNTWLVREGLMSLGGSHGETKKLDDLFGGGTFWQGVDWSKTRAYCLGLAQVYINLKGREAQGIVEPADYEKTREEIIQKLLALKDPATGKAMVQSVRKREDIYTGPFMEEMPDLVYGFQDGYRVSWQTSLGGIPPEILVDNTERWSGDHCGADPDHAPGFLLTSFKRGPGTPSIYDVAPTALDLLGLPPFPHADGRSLRGQK